MANLTPVNSLDNVIQLETNTIALGGVGGIMNAQAQALLNRTAYLNSALANKLDSSAYVQHYRGKFSSLVALETAIATGEDGDYAIVDTGGGNDAVYHIWDAQDGWVSGGTTTASTTDTVTEGSTNLYFTAARAVSALSTTLSSYATTSSLSSYATTSSLSSYATTSSLSSYATTSSVTDAISTSFEPTINTQTVSAYTVQTADNDGKTILRMDNASANTATITTAQTKPISIRQAGTGTTTLAAGSGVMLNGTLAFTAQHQTKTVIPLGSGNYDVVG